MSESIAKRLRVLAEEWWECYGDIHVDLLRAADEIERLGAELESIKARGGDRVRASCPTCSRWTVWQEPVMTCVRCGDRWFET